MPSRVRSIRVIAALTILIAALVFHVGAALFLSRVLRGTTPGGPRESGCRNPTRLRNHGRGGRILMWAPQGRPRWKAILDGVITREVTVAAEGESQVKSPD